MRTLLLAAVLVLPMGAQVSTSGTEPRARIADYPASAVLKRFSLGAEYMVRSFGQHNEMFTTDDHLVVEVAVLPAVTGEPLMVSLNHLRLRINGKDTLHPQIPQIVANQIRHPEWETGQGRGVEGGIGPVILGRRQPEARFPGDPTPGRRPPPIEVPKPDHEGAAGKDTQQRDYDAVVQFALPEGPARGPVSGFVYFPYRKAAGKLKSVELVYKNEAGETATLKLL